MQVNASSGSFSISAQNKVEIRKWNALSRFFIFLLSGGIVVAAIVALKSYELYSFSKNKGNYDGNTGNVLRKNVLFPEEKEQNQTYPSISNSSTLFSNSSTRAIISHQPSADLPPNPNPSTHPTDKPILSKTNLPIPPISNLTLPPKLQQNTSQPLQNTPTSTPIRKTNTNTNTNINSRPKQNPDALTLNHFNQRIYDNFRGNSSFIPNKTIFGAIIMTDYSEKPHVNRTKVKLQNSTTEIDKMQAVVDLSATRSKNSREMIAQLPFPVVHWPPVFSKACPYSAIQHKSERGLIYAHLQIWLDFVYFDPEVMTMSIEKKVKGTYVNEDSGYMKGTFMASENGTLYKYGSPYKDDNILVIFEDDSDIAVTDLHDALYKEFSLMTTDLLFLGWCVGRAAKPVPLCAHAYAFTLEGARKAIKYLEPCGKALDEQFVIMAKNNWITYREAFPSSYKNKFNSNYPRNHDGTHGIFHQKKMGSFNGH